MSTGNSIRPERAPVDTSTGAHAFDAELEHERSLRYFLEHTELGVLDKDQMGVISLVHAVGKLGLYLPATQAFFTDEKFSIRTLSSGEEGRGRIQAKEVITAGAFPMSLLFGEQKSGWGDFIKSFIPGRKTDSSNGGK